jgi:hypothetical protein
MSSASENLRPQSVSQPPKKPFGFSAFSVPTSLEQMMSSQMGAALFR